MSLAADAASCSTGTTIFDGAHGVSSVTDRASSFVRWVARRE